MGAFLFFNMCSFRHAGQLIHDTQDCWALATQYRWAQSISVSAVNIGERSQDRWAQSGLLSAVKIGERSQDRWAQSELLSAVKIGERSQNCWAQSNRPWDNMSKYDGPFDVAQGSLNCWSVSGWSGRIPLSFIPSLGPDLYYLKMSGTKSPL